MTTRTKIFIAYARADKELLEKGLLPHLAPIMQNESSNVEIWYDAQLLGGEEWQETINTKLNEADIFLFLISSDAIYSSYFAKEFDIALKRHQENTARVVPVILRECAWQEDSRFIDKNSSGKTIDKFQALLYNDEAIASAKNLDRAYTEVVKKIKSIVTDIQNKKNREYAQSLNQDKQKKQRENNQLIAEQQRQQQLQDFSIYLADARKYYTIGEYRQALVEINKALAIFPEDADALSLQVTTKQAIKSEQYNALVAWMPSLKKTIYGILTLFAIGILFLGGKKIISYNQPSSQPVTDSTITDFNDKPKIDTSITGIKVPDKKEDNKPTATQPDSKTATTEQSKPPAVANPPIVANVTAYTETVGSVSFKMKRIPAGSFTMGSNDGSDDEKPAHPVTLSAFSMMETEVTQALWREVMGSDPPELYNKGCDECPVERVSWDDAQAFIKKLNTLTGKTYRLPTEAEWEYAAKPPTANGGYYKYSGSNNVTDVAWYSDNYKNSKHGSQGTTHPVKTKQANGYGLYDMSGNVWEWCQDWYDEKFYSKSVAKNNNPVNNVKSSDYRVLRGGSWGYNVSYSRVSGRYSGTPDNRYVNDGFRLVVSGT